LEQTIDANSHTVPLKKSRFKPAYSRTKLVQGKIPKVLFADQTFSRPRSCRYVPMADVGASWRRD